MGESNKTRWTDLYEFFQFAKQNPGMVVRDCSLPELETLCGGYSLALKTHGIEEFGTEFRSRFGDYLYQRFGWSTCQGWAIAIQCHSRAKDKGWNRFFDLLEDFRQAQQRLSG